MNFTASGGLFSFLAERGGREKVTDVFLTHHHPDHICALYTIAGRREKVFKKAVVWSCVPETVRKYSLEFLGDEDAYTVCPLPSSSEIFYLYQTNIHAPCHTVYEIINPQKNVIIWGDLLPTAMHLRPKFRKVLFPAGSPSFYEGLMEKIVDAGSLSFLYHDPRRTLVKIIRSKFGFSAVQV